MIQNLGSTEPDDRPVGPVFVLGNGTRVAIDLRYAGIRDDWHVWTPVIEGSILKLMPMIHGFDADYWPKSAAMLLPSLGMTADVAWSERLHTNSPVLKRVRAAGREWTR